jgi:predicted AAA+ superfamily ATPase
MFQRIAVKSIKADLYKGKAIVIYGPRQSGKTTLVYELLKDLREPFLFLSGDEPDLRVRLPLMNSADLKNLIGVNKFMFIDEAQRFTNIGLTLKLIVDQIPNVQVIATGSSALGLADNIKEPLTGRVFEHFLYPFCYSELKTELGQLAEQRNLEQRLLYGSYPAVINETGDKRKILSTLGDQFLYKDILTIDFIKKPAVIEKLLQALALQIGQEVSYNELGRMLQLESRTVEKYIDLLEKTFVVFKLNAFSRNFRNELVKSKKIYFVDNGIRNQLINAFQPLNTRADLGALWENYVITERRKVNAYVYPYRKMWFWRTKQQQEIDLIETENETIFGSEIKWQKPPREKYPLTFCKTYPEAKLSTVHRENVFNFLTI